MSSLRFIFRTWDGTAYGISAANVDGSNRVDYHSPTFKDPQFIRLVASHNRRWVAWIDGGEIRTAASARLTTAKTLMKIAMPAAVLAVSDDGDKIAYRVGGGDEVNVAPSDLYIVTVHDRVVRLLRHLAGPFIWCVGDGAFDPQAQRLITVGCGAGMAAGLLLINVMDGLIISEDRGFAAWPDQWAFAQDLATVWLIQNFASEDDVVRYDTGTRSRVILYRSPGWRQSDGSTASNLAGISISPDESTVVFRRYPPDLVEEAYVLSASGGEAQILLKRTDVTGAGGWSPDGNFILAIADNSIPGARLRLVDRQTKALVPVRTGADFETFLGWIVA